MLNIPRTFGALTGPIPTSYLDNNFLAIAQTFVSTIAELRTIPKTGSGVAFTLGYYNKGDGTTGCYWYNPTDTTSADNGGTIIVASDGGRWYLDYNGEVNAKNFGAPADGVTDDYPFIQKAIDNVFKVYCSHGTYILSQQLLIRNSCVGLRGDGQLVTVFQKKFNGNAVNFSNGGAVLKDFGIVGNGATFTGGGMFVSGNSNIINNVRITDTADSPIIVQGQAAVYLSVHQCFLLPTAPSSTFSIRLSGSADLGAAPTARVFSEITGGARLVDFTGMNAVTLVDSFGIDVLFSLTSAKVKMIGNRLTNAIGDVTIFGQDHIIVGNQWGFGLSSNTVYIDTSASNITFDQSNTILTNVTTTISWIQDLNAGLGQANLNTIFVGLDSFTETWFGSTTSATLGNATVVTVYERNGRTCRAQIRIITGSTTVVAVGDWSFSLPLKAAVNAVGSFKIVPSSGNIRTGIAVVSGGASAAFLYLDNTTGTPYGSTSGTFGTGTDILIDIEYTIAFS